MTRSRSFNPSPATKIMGAMGPESPTVARNARRLSQPLVLAYHPPSKTFGTATGPDGVHFMMEALEGGPSVDDNVGGVPEELLRARASRVASVRAKRTDRTTKHIGQFLRLNVQLAGAPYCDITVDKNHTIEYLAHQIEAEYAFRNVLSSVQNGEEEIERKVFAPLEIGQMFDIGMLPLKFSDVIGDVLCFNDTVLVINTYDSTQAQRAAAEANAADSAERRSVQHSHGSSTSLNTDRVSVNAPQPVAHTLTRNREISLSASPTLDDRLQILLHNKLGLNFFHQFCLEEYSIENLLFWLEVEAFQSCDPVHRPALARFIYLVYIAPAAPLLLNISPEIRNDVKESFHGDLEAMDVSVFDEVQENVYAVIKGHSYVRYEKSPLNTMFLNTKKTDKSQYIDAKIIGPFASNFDIDYSEIAMLSTVLEDPSSEASAAKLLELGQGRPLAVNSSPFRVLFLSSILSNYFPTSRARLDHYFDDISRVSWSQKQKKMLKEKKLSKFFGQRPSNDQMQRQILNSRRLSVNSMNSQMAPGSGRRNENAIDAILSSTEEETGGGSNENRRKKMEKLQQIFGNKLPTKQQVEQSLVSANDEVNLVFSTDNSDDDLDRSTESLEAIATTNDLNPEQRRILQKRNKKLANLLGETMNHNIVSNLVATAVTTPDLPGLPSGTTAGGAGDQHNLNIVTTVPSLGCTELSLITPTTEDDESDPDVGSNQFKKKKLDKLSNMLGERINTDHISEAQATIQTTSVNPSIGRALPPPRVLTVEERKTFQRRANKLEKIMGMLPPTEALMPAVNSSAESLTEAQFSDQGLKARQNIRTLSQFIEKAKDVVELLETLSAVGANPAAASAVLPDSPSSPTGSDDNGFLDPDSADSNKENRQRRLNKLRRFFGNEIEVSRFIEQQIIVELERSFEEDIENEDERMALRKEVEGLRRTIERRSGEFGEELHADKAKGTGTTHGAAYLVVSSDNEMSPSDETSPRSLSSRAGLLRNSAEKGTPPVMDERTRKQSITRKEVNGSTHHATVVPAVVHPAPPAPAPTDLLNETFAVLPKVLDSDLDPAVVAAAAAVGCFDDLDDPFLSSAVANEDDDLLALSSVGAGQGQGQGLAQKVSPTHSRQRTTYPSAGGGKHRAVQEPTPDPSPTLNDVDPFAGDPLLLLSDADLDAIAGSAAGHQGAGDFLPSGPYDWQEGSAPISSHTAGIDQTSSTITLEQPPPTAALPDPRDAVPPGDAMMLAYHHPLPQLDLDRPASLLQPPPVNPSRSSTSTTPPSTTMPPDPSALLDMDVDTAHCTYPPHPHPGLQPPINHPYHPFEHPHPAAPFDHPSPFDNPYDNPYEPSFDPHALRHPHMPSPSAADADDRLSVCSSGPGLGIMDPDHRMLMMMACSGSGVDDPRRFGTQDVEEEEEEEDDMGIAAHTFWTPFGHTRGDSGVVGVGDVVMPPQDHDGGMPPPPFPFALPPVSYTDAYESPYGSVGAGSPGDLPASPPQHPYDEVGPGVYPYEYPAQRYDHGAYDPFGYAAAAARVFQPEPTTYNEVTQYPDMFRGDAGGMGMGGYQQHDLSSALPSSASMSSQASSVAAVADPAGLVGAPIATTTTTGAGSGLYDMLQMVMQGTASTGGDAAVTLAGMIGATPAMVMDVDPTQAVQAVLDKVRIP
ncbi:hypothetical protein HK101_007408 [Irineochytrium annulatum]|nr:hypothetical protein HK101_007408 [Irineochytrium annulatum]